MVIAAENKAVYRAVTLGPIVDGMRIVRTGLRKDERIVVNGLQRIRPNDVVTPVAVSMDGRDTVSPAAKLAATNAKQQ
jgi:multidrug efflux system membrane fusion protein